LEGKANCQIPNPYSVGDVLSCENLEGKEELQLEIFDLNGKSVLLQPFDNQLIENSFQNGLYIFQIRNNQEILTTKKVVFQR